MQLHLLEMVHKYRILLQLGSRVAYGHIRGHLPGGSEQRWLHYVRALDGRRALVNHALHRAPDRGTRTQAFFMATTDRIPHLSDNLSRAFGGVRAMSLSQVVVPHIDGLDDNGTGQICVSMACVASPFSKMWDHLEQTVAEARRLISVAQFDSPGDRSVLYTLYSVQACVV